MSRNILELIESKHAVENVRLNNDLRIWPLLRERMYFYDLKRRLDYSSKKRTRKASQLARNFFYGFVNLFRLRKFDYLCFENTNKRILVDGKFYDIYFDAWADKLGQPKSLFIEFAHYRHYPKNKVHSKNIVSDLPFKLGSSLFSFFVFPKIKNGEVLEEIKMESGIALNMSKELKHQLGEYYFYRFLFGWIKPKAVFVLSSFSKTSIVMAAKNRGVKVYEAQHGFIGESHPFYHVKEKRFDESYPDALFSFGNYEVENNDHFIFKPDQIIPIGGLELEHLKSKKAPKALGELRDRYNTIFCITLQGLKEDEVIRSTLEFSRKNPDSLFILCPKNRSNDYSEYLKNPGYRLSEHSIYEILKIADYNITIFSTTAVEGVTMGAKTIFYNVDNLSKKYFDISKLGGSVVEDGEFLSAKHLTDSTGPVEPYYINGYFANVENHKLNL